MKTESQRRAYQHLLCVICFTITWARKGVFWVVEDRLS